MGKQIKKLILAMVVAVMMLSTSMTAFAANGNEIKTMKAGTYAANGKFKSVSKVTLYTNGETAANPRSIDLAVQAKAKDGFSRVQYIVTSTNNSVATVVRKSNDITDADYFNIKIVAGIKTGDAVITLTDKYNLKKSTKIKVTVKKLAEEITFGNNVAANKVNLTMGGKLTLDAVTNGDASNKKLKYTIVSQSILGSNGIYVDAGTKYKVVKVDSKGRVTGVNPGKAVISVSAQDQTVLNLKNKKVAGGYNELIEVYVQAGNISNVNILNPVFNEKGKIDTINLKTNANSDVHTYKVVAEAYNNAGRRVEDGVTFTSSKPAVATVDKNGVITAVGNGTAKITVGAADGAKIKGVPVINVKVTTDAEKIDIPNDDVIVFLGKTFKLGATIDKAVSTKKLVYLPPRCVDDQGNELPLDIKNKSKLNTISVSSNGTIKGLRPGTATFVVQTQDGSVSRKVYVTVVDPVKYFSVGVPAYTKKGLNTGAKSTTLYLNNNVAENETAFDGCQISVSILTQAGYAVSQEDANLTFTSDNKKVATVDADGYISAVAPGKANITVATNDGSKKKAVIKVTVAQKVEEITLANAVDGELYVPNNGSVTLSAVTNNNATNKKVTYTFTPAGAANITLKGSRLTAKNAFSTTGESVGTLTVTAKDATVFPYQAGFSTTVDVYVTDGVAGVTADMIDIASCEGLSIKNGDKSAALCEAIQIPAEVTNRALVWKSLDTKVLTVDKNGVITGKKVGTATVTVMSKATGATSSVVVRVGKSDKEFVAGLDADINFLIQKEGFGMGIQPSFDQKNAQVNVRILDAWASLEKAKEIGKEVRDEYELDENVDKQQAKQDVREQVQKVFDMFEDAFVDSGYRSLTIVDESKGTTWVVVRQGTKATIYENGEVVADPDTTRGEALDLAKYIVGDDKEAANWNGRSYTMTILRESAAANFDTLEYEATYRMSFTAETVDIDKLVDVRIADAIAKSENDRTQTGISAVTYDAAKNIATVNICDGSVTIDELDAATRDEMVANFKKIFAEAATVTVEVQDMMGLSEADSRQTFVRKDSTDIDAAVNGLLDRVYNRMSGVVTNLSGLNDTTVRAKATYQFEDLTYSLEYYVVFTRSLSAIDTKVDDAIAASVEELNATGAGFGYMNYNASNNTITAGIEDTETLVSDMTGMGLYELVKTIMDEESAVGARVYTNIKSKEFENTAEITPVALANVLVKSLDANLGSLVSKKAYVDVYYNTSKSKTITYTISFVLDVVSVDAEVDAQISEYVENVDHDLIDEMTYDVQTNTVNVVLDGDKADYDVLSLSNCGIYDVMQNTLGVQGQMVPYKATFKALNGTKTYTDLQNNEMPSKEDMFVIVDKFIGAQKIADLNNKSVVITVYYTDDDNKTAALTYTVVFNVSKSNIIDPSTFKEVEETAEEATEEVVEEVVEEAVEEVVEEVVETVAE